MSKYLYTPYDIALFFECSDFKHGEEKAIRDDLWEKRRAVLPPQDRRDKYRWLRKTEYEPLPFDAIFMPEAESINAALQALWGCNDTCQFGIQGIQPSGGTVFAENRPFLHLHLW